MTAKKKENGVVETNGNGVNRIADTPAPAFHIERPDFRVITIPIIGVTPLIVHAWGDKAKRMMLEKQTGGKASAKKREPKDPKADYESSLYVADDGWCGVPATGFKAALVGCCRSVDGLPMTLAKRMMFVECDGRSTKQNVDLVRIIGEHRMREDMVRLESGVADLRYRAEFPEWKATLTITYNAGVVQAQQILNLVELAGLTEGTCEWRPSSPKSSTGTYGRWRCVTEGDVTDSE